MAARSPASRAGGGGPPRAPSSRRPSRHARPVPVARARVAAHHEAMAYGNPATYRRAAAVLAALLAACSHAPRAVEPASRKAIALPSPGNPQPGWKVPAEAYLSERNRCIDEALRQQGLNRFGDLDGTTYPEG